MPKLNNKTKKVQEKQMFFQMVDMQIILLVLIIVDMRLQTIKKSKRKKLSKKALKFKKKIF